ncbi:MAG: Ldh family oxidoreductase [Bauldia sp.]|nr:Ldh family oxidoreductase [Bauldia sp.]
MDQRFDPDALRTFAEEILTRAGVPAEPAHAVATGLVEGDVYGHVTHGLALLGGYVEEIENGTMATDGRPDVVADAGAAVTWDARRLPGVWTTMLAVDEAVARAGRHGVGAVAIRRSHHIACLAAFLEAPARAGNVVLIFSSDPSGAHVAPFGGTTPLYTPDPIAAGIPADPDPILIDVSMSITTAGMVGKLKAAGERFPHKWLLGPDGEPTDDPNVLDGGGSILPLGGLEYGHKGFGLGLLVEALTQGLAGYGRAEGPSEWGAGVLVLAFAPARFAGAEAFRRQTTWLAKAARAAPPRDPAKPVRLPGQLALARKRAAAVDGVPLSPAIVATLAGLAAKYGAPLPEAKEL